MMMRRTKLCLVHAAHEALCQFSVSDWSKMFVDCIHVVFCHYLSLVAGFNAICIVCLAGVPSSSLEMCPVNLCLF